MERPVAVALAVVLAAVTAPAAVATHGTGGAYNPDVDSAWDTGRSAAADDLPSLVRAVGVSVADSLQENSMSTLGQASEDLVLDAADQMEASGSSLSEEPVPQTGTATWEDPEHPNQQEDACGGTVAYAVTVDAHYVCLDEGDTGRTGLYAESNGCQGLQTVHEDITGCGFVDPDADCATQPQECSLILGRTDDAGADLSLP